MISIRDIINQLDDLVRLHDGLLQLSKDKTEYVKTGDMEKLSKLLMQERKYVQAITQLEDKRQQTVEKTFADLNIHSEEKTVTELLNYTKDEEVKAELERAMATLVEVIVNLRESEQLNSDLLAQSMQFVNLSLDMLQPHNQRINYNEKSTGNDTVKQSVFDSKA